MPRSAIRLSLEIFPPNPTLPAKEKRYWEAIETFCQLKPEYISITSGAFGSGRGDELTLATALKILAKGATPAVHITCLGKSEETARQLIEDYKRRGIKRAVALRGDMPADPRVRASLDPQSLSHACQLVALLAQVKGFHISVAAYPETHPEASSAKQDLIYLKEKLAAGADCAITQFFFDPEIFFRFRDKAVQIGINKPIIPGILPIFNFDKVLDFAKKCHVEVPGYLYRMYQNVERGSLDDKLLAMNILSHQITRLISEGVDRFHLYTLNETVINSHIARWLQEAF